MSTKLIALACALAIPGVAAPAALASSIQQTTSGDITAVSYAAAAGEANDVTVTGDALSGLTITDPGATITHPSGDACTIAAGGHSATCPGDPLGPRRVDCLGVSLGDQADTLTDHASLLGTYFDCGFPLPTYVDGGDGADTISGSPGSDYITAGSGDDVVNGNGGQDALIGGADNDTLDGGANSDLVSGGDGNDTITGGPGDDGADGVLFGQSGVSGGNGDDTVNGGDGNDIVSGDGATGPFSIGPNDGTDVVNGEAGDDVVFGNGGNDTLTGGEGDDVFPLRSTAYSAGEDPGSDTVTGGSGYDAADYSAAPSGVTITADGAAADDGPATGAKDNVGADVEELDGSLYNDVLTGNGTDNQLFGSGGDDTLNGLGGDDVLHGDGGGGDNGRDTLNGGDGRDQLYGGLNSDTLNGDGGDDTLFDGNDGDPDTLQGGDGADTADYGADNVDLTITLDGVANDGGIAENDNVLTENVITGSGNDTVTTASGRNIVDTGLGDDTIDVSGDPGTVDDLTCGAGIDTATVDDSDAVAETGEFAKCETINGRAANRSPAAILQPVTVLDTTAPRITAKLSRCGRTTKQFKAKGCTLTVTGDEPFRVSATMTVRSRRAVVSKAGDLVLASRNTGFSGTSRKFSFKLRPTGRLLSSVPRKYKVSVLVEAYDKAGNRKATTRTVTIRN